MAQVYVVSDNIISPIGSSTGENFLQAIQSVSGIALHNEPQLSPTPFYASLFEKKEEDKQEDQYTYFEQLLIESVGDALQRGGIDPKDPKTIFILSSTKGNISLLEDNVHSAELYKRISLHSSAQLLAEHFGFVHSPVVISNACISGLLAILTGKRLIESGHYKTAVIAGADLVSKFVLSGFQSFQAIGSEPCKPFDVNRNGITLGEGAATVILSSDKKYNRHIQVMGGAVSNDANHISAPSRTGKELAYIIEKSLRDSELIPADMGFISAHGTATLYNDEMEAKAITLAGLESVPVNSLKGYYGHTLGAAGLIESILSIQSLQNNLVLPTKGFEEKDPSIHLNISHTIFYTPLQYCLKTASGFGGCNAALVFGKS